MANEDLFTYTNSTLVNVYKCWFGVEVHTSLECVIRVIRYAEQTKLHTLLHPLKPKCALKLRYCH